MRTPGRGGRSAEPAMRSQSTPFCFLSAPLCLVQPGFLLQPLDGRFGPDGCDQGLCEEWET